MDGAQGTGNRQPATGNGQPATGNGQQATGNAHETSHVRRSNRTSISSRSIVPFEHRTVLLTRNVRISAHCALEIGSLFANCQLWMRLSDNP